MSESRMFAPFPASWGRSTAFRSLKPTHKDFLISLWFAAFYSIKENPQGHVPKCPKQARLMAGTAHKRSQVIDILDNLTRLGFLVDEGFELRLKHFQTVTRKTARNLRKKREKISSVNSTIPQGSTDPSRGRGLYSLKENRNNTTTTERPLEGSLCVDGADEKSMGEAFMKKHQGGGE